MHDPSGPVPLSPAQSGSTGIGGPVVVRVVVRGAELGHRRPLVPRAVQQLDGTVALEPVGSGTYELSKMAVDPADQGRGAGRQLIAAALERVRELGGTRVFLGSNRRLAAAVHLYEEHGFVHVPREEIGDLPYQRADVFMALDLDGPGTAPGAGRPAPAPAAPGG